MTTLLSSRRHDRRRQGLCRRALELLLLVGTLIDGSAAVAQSQDESAVKTAYIYNFSKFIDWPATAFANSDAPITFCVIDQSLPDSALSKLDKRKVNQRELAVEKITLKSAHTPCHILYLGELSAAQVSEVIRLYRDDPVLLIGDTGQASEKFAAINLTSEDRKLRFNVNLGQASAHHLEISAYLLKLALQVER